VTRAVVDTSVLIRYLIRPSAAIRALVEDLWVAGTFVMITSPDLVAELAEVLARPRMRTLIEDGDAVALIDAIQALAEPIPTPGPILAYTRDPKDDKFVACAVAGRADFLVSTDQDLLVLQPMLGVRFVTPEEFVEALAALGRNS